MIGLVSLATWLSITSAEYTSLKELTQAARGIKIIDGIEQAQLAMIIIITSLMIYLANADQLQNNNTMSKAEIIKELREILNDYHYKSDTEHMSKDVVTSLENLLGSLLK